MTEPAGADRKHVILEALVLGIGRSPIARIVSVDLVRSALEMNIDDIVQGDKVNLDVAWKTIEPLPGFEANSAKPAMCWIKAQEARLGFKVDLPPALSSIKAHELAAMAAMCPIKPRELDHVMAGYAAPALGEITAPIEMPLDPPKRTPTRPPDESKKTTRPPSMMTTGPIAPPKPASDGRRKAMATAASIAALLAVCFVGFTIFRACDDSVAFKKFDGADLGAIPVKDVRLLGTQVGATLTDPNWVSRPVEEKRRQMTEAFERLQSRNVTVLFLQDERQKTVATAQWRGREVLVMFY